MAGFNYNRRAGDSLELSVVVDFYLETISAKCKGLIAYTAKAQVERLKDQKKVLESKLSRLVSSTKSGVIEYFKKRSALKKLRASISELNRKIVDCINSIYRAFVVA